MAASTMAVKNTLKLGQSNDMKMTPIVGTPYFLNLHTLQINPNGPKPEIVDVGNMSFWQIGKKLYTMSGTMRDFGTYRERLWTKKMEDEDEQNRIG